MTTYLLVIRVPRITSLLRKMAAEWCAWQHSLGASLRDRLNARIEADLILGQHAKVAAELRKLVAENPLDEKLYVHLMVALSQSGRRADALQV